MSDIMPYGRWMKYTYGGVTSIRSSQLKAIDAALSGCHGSPTTENLDRLRTAIVGWMQKEGPRWKSSVRNRYHAVDDLHKQSMGIPVPPRAAADVIGFSYLRAESRGIVDDLFRGKSIDWKPGILRKLANIIRVIVRDVLEKNAANQRMRSAQVTGEIFDICPLVGAYLILCVPTSVMLNTVFDRISEHGWRGDVERTVQKHLLPLQGHARRVVEEHRFVIPALRNYPGMFVRNEEKLQQMEKRKGKTGMEGFGPG